MKYILDLFASLQVGAETFWITPCLLGVLLSSHYRASQRVRTGGLQEGCVDVIKCQYEHVGSQNDAVPSVRTQLVVESCVRSVLLRVTTRLQLRRPEAVRTVLLRNRRP